MARESVNLVADQTVDWRLFEDLSLPPILEHTLAAFAEHGYHGTTVRDIARRVGVTVPALYYHYDNKQDLLVTLLTMGIEDVLRRVTAAVEEAGADPVDQFRVIVRAVVLQQAHYRDLAFLDTEIRSLEPDNRVAYTKRRAVIQRMLADTLDQGRPEKSTPPASDCARAILSMCQGVARWYRPEGPLTPEQIADQYVGFALGVATPYLYA